MVSTETRTESPRPGDLLVRIGGVVFAVGAVATLVTVAPLFLGTDPFPTVAYLLSMLMGVGFAIAAAGVVRGVSAQRKEARAAAAAAAATAEGPGVSAA